MTHGSPTQASPHFTKQSSPGSSKPLSEDVHIQLFKIQVAQDPSTHRPRLPISRAAHLAECHMKSQGCYLLSAQFSWQNIMGQDSSQ